MSDRRQRQQPPNLLGILALAGNPAQLCRIKVGPQWDRHSEPPLSASLESDHARVGEPLSESQSEGFGISAFMADDEYVCSTGADANWAVALCRADTAVDLMHSAAPSFTSSLTVWSNCETDRQLEPGAEEAGQNSTWRDKGAYHV